MARALKTADTGRWICFDKRQENLGTIIAVATTIKGAKIEERPGVTRIYIPRKSQPTVSSRHNPASRKKKGLTVFVKNNQSKERHYCAIMLK